MEVVQLAQLWVDGLVTRPLDLSLGILFRSRLVIDMRADRIVAVKDHGGDVIIRNASPDHLADRAPEPLAA